jgi:hypothetical protein
LDRCRTYPEGVAAALNERVKNETMLLFGHLVNSAFRNTKQILKTSNVVQRIAPPIWTCTAATTNKHVAADTIKAVLAHQEMVPQFA